MLETAKAGGALCLGISYSLVAPKYPGLWDVDSIPGIHFAKACGTNSSTHVPPVLKPREYGSIALFIPLSSFLLSNGALKIFPFFSHPSASHALFIPDPQLPHHLGEYS